MESSRDFGNGDECNSSTESGWTMYLCSPENSDQSDIYDNERYIDTYKGFHDDDDSDDSMASDASSGPVWCVQMWEKGQNGNGLYGNKVQEEDKSCEKSFSNKKSKNKKQEEEESALSAKEAEKLLKLNGKVRKNSWFGKIK